MPRLNVSKKSESSPSRNGGTVRPTSPPTDGSSILMTSAPRSLSCRVAQGPAPNCSIARIRTSARGRLTCGSVRCGAMDFAVSDDLRDIRAAVRELCTGFDGAYWRGLEPDRYPRSSSPPSPSTAGSRRSSPSRTAARGSSSAPPGDPRGDLGERRQPGRLPRPDVRDGHAAQARQRRPEAAVAAADRQRRAAPAGLRRHRADRRLGHDADQDQGHEDRRRLPRQRPEGLDLARALQRPDAAARPHHAPTSPERTDGPERLPRRHARARRLSSRSSRSRRS